MARNDKSAPHNMEAEEALLGAMLLSEAAIADAVVVVEVEDFYRPSHQHIFEAISKLYSQGDPIDLVTVCHELETANLLETVGGPQRVMDIQGATPSTTGAKKYAEIVRDLAVIRRLAVIGREIAEESLEANSDAASLLHDAEDKLYKLGATTGDSTTHEPTDFLLDGLERLEKLSESDSSMIGSATGYVDLDRVLKGLQSNALYILGARPSMGKSVAATNIAAHVALHEKRPVLFFSLEMGREELTQRIVCSEGLIENGKYKVGNLAKDDWVAMAEVMSNLATSNLWIDDSPNVSLINIRSTAKKMKSKLGDLGLIIIDYLQLMDAPGAESRHLGISEISRGLKILARELETPILALSQLSRGLESRMDKRPMLSDLRESGSLEQDSDVVMFLYRDQVYNDQSEDTGIGELIVAKHRNGPTATVRLGFMEEHTRFVNLAKL